MVDSDSELRGTPPEPLPYNDQQEQKRPKSVKFEDEELTLSISNLDWK